MSYPNITFIPAAVGNYTVGTTNPRFVDRVIIHTVNGSKQSAIQWFQDPTSRVSTHYIVGFDGSVTQMVTEKDVAYGAGNWVYNLRAIQIEHEGSQFHPELLTPIQYQVSAQLTRTICDKYSIPLDRSHIIGHAEVPNQLAPIHTDPGTGWQWANYMNLITGGVTLNGHLVPQWAADFYNANGGERIFGLALTSVFTHDNLPTVVFERAVMQYNVALPDTYKVQLRLLGRDWAAANGVHI